MKQANRQDVEGLLSFIQKSPTAYNAAFEMAEILEKNGFQRVEEAQEWDLQAGGSYYLTRNQSSLIAFRIPTKKPRQVLLTATHTDSPMFKVKPNGELVGGGYVKLNTEVYGGTILSSWLDRPLSLAGRVILEQDGVLRSKPFRLDRDIALIPSLAIHQNRRVNEGCAYNPAVDMLPVLSAASGEEGKGLQELLCEELQCESQAIKGGDLFLYNRCAPSIWGADESFFSAPRIDDLMCVYGTLMGFCETIGLSDSLNLFFAADNEETGSATKQGAGSRMLADTIDRICEAMQVDRRRLLANGLMVSADNSHAIHPNHPEMSDKENAPLMNQGVVIKTNAAQKYATDGLSASLMAEICRVAGVPTQVFANRSDLLGGSTLGSISNTCVPIQTVDIGMAQLAMHSSYETAGCVDVTYLIQAMKAFYGVGLDSDRDGEVALRFEKREEE